MSARAFPGPVSAAGRLLSRRGGLAIACYLLAVLVWLVLGCVNFAADDAARANGSLAEESLPLSGLPQVGLGPRGGRRRPPDHSGKRGRPGGADAELHRPV